MLAYLAVSACEEMPLYTEDFPLFNIDFSPLPFDETNISELQQSAGEDVRTRGPRGWRGHMEDIEDSEQDKAESGTGSTAEAGASGGTGASGGAGAGACILRTSQRKRAKDIKTKNELAWLHQISEANKRKEKQELRRQIVDQVSHSDQSSRKESNSRSKYQSEVNQTSLYV